MKGPTSQSKSRLQHRSAEENSNGLIVLIKWPQPSFPHGPQSKQDGLVLDTDAGPSVLQHRNELLLGMVPAIGQ